jgi:hypothetical protein
VSRRDVDEEVAYLSVGDSFEMLTDSFDVPRSDERNSRLYDVPTLLYELV